MLRAILTMLVAAFFALMGLVAIVDPKRILAPFGIHPLPIDGRNEVRAVYGGFGFAISLLLLATLRVESIRNGVLIAVAAALLGMAAGRVLSAIIDRRLGRYPAIFLGVEIVLAALLLLAR